MASLYIPKTETYEYIKSLMQGFCLELDNHKNPVLLLKVEASLSISIINGASIEIILRNPNIASRSCTIYIYDLLQNPFYVTWQNFGEEDTIIKGFDEVAIKLASSKQITVVLYNELSHPIFSTKLEVDSNVDEFHQWLFNVYNSDAYKYLNPPDYRGNYFPEDKINGFKVKIINKDNSKENKFSVIAPEYQEKWRENSMYYKDTFNYDDYTGEGKHGYYQELSIANNLDRFFTPEKDFFISPKCGDGKELSDFIIIYKNIVILIESKCIMSEKQTIKHSTISKAITQLNLAEQLISGRNIELLDKKLEKHLKNIELIEKICILNDKVILNDENTKGITNKFRKEDLPLFFSVTTFFELLASLQLKNKEFLLSNLILNIVNLNAHFVESNEKIFYFREFTVEGLSVDDLNKLGNSKNNI